MKVYLAPVGGKKSNQFHYLGLEFLWDPVDPHSCFDDTSCGYYISPCEFFGINAPGGELDSSEICCAEIKTC